MMRVAVATRSPAYPPSAKTPLDERKQSAEAAGEQPAPVAILNAGRVRLDHEATPVRVNQRMTFAPVDLLAGIITARPPASVVLMLWLSMIAAEGLGFAPDPLAIRYIQRMVDLLEQAGIAPGCKPAIDPSSRAEGPSATGATDSQEASRRKCR